MPRGVATSWIADEKGGFPIFEDLTRRCLPEEWVEEHRELLESLVRRHGGYLLRHFAVENVSDFNRFASTVSPNLLEYTQASSARTVLEGNVYTSTEFRSDLEIPLHNEKSYTSSYPQKIFFCCLVPPDRRGQTPLADSRRVLAHLDREVIDRFDKEGVLYTRTYDNCYDLSWQQVFQTDSKDAVERFCKSYKIDYIWRGERLKTLQQAQATLVHPKTGEKVWFNQAHIFHISIYGEAFSQIAEADFPRNAYYGDGTPLEREVIEQIRSAYRREEIIFPWEVGDILVLDNILMAHGRRSFEGARKIAVAMG